MSVRTTSDELRDEAKELITRAYKLLDEALDDETWGHDQYNSDYVDTMEESITELRKIKRKL